MANLTLAELRKYEYRAPLFVDKVFNKNKKINKFATDDGLFEAIYIKLDGKTYDKYNLTIEKLINNKDTKRCEVVGTLQGQPGRKTLNLNKFQKSEEFGGQPVGGKRENKGNIFERELGNRFVEILNGGVAKGLYSKQAEKIIKITSKTLGSAPMSSLVEAGANKARPLILEGGEPIIKPGVPIQHGPQLTDITLTHKNKKKSYLSLKFGSTLTFVNSGVARYFFPATEMEKGKLSNPTGIAVLKALGIDNQKFCDVFTKYGKVQGKPTVPNHIENVAGKVNKAGLHRLLTTAIGANYWMVHGKEGGVVDFWFMPASRNNAMATITGPIMLMYGGVDGKGKRIDMKFSNQYFDFKLNIRNKQGGLYPSHLMVDYKSKAATGKQRL
tara:strand:+ start:170 stop:1324 length:1155 start_codon:yes stop_codon:yes gene_type:complete